MVVVVVIITITTVVVIVVVSVIVVVVVVVIVVIVASLYKVNAMGIRKVKGWNVIAPPPSTVTISSWSRRVVPRLKLQNSRLLDKASQIVSITFDIRQV